jgi:DNA excision repair protein ERCC-2
MELFPFEEIRDKQRELVKEIENAVDSGESLVAHAPTGLGKTAAAVTPMIEDALENDRKVFFVTPRHSQHEIALETVKNINEKHDKNIISVDLIGKSHLCEADASTQTGEGPDCPRYNETYTEAHELSTKAKSMIDRLKHQNLRAEEVKKNCSKVCPYEILMQMMSDADIVIADYFHVFHPKVREIVQEKADVDLKEINLIVDEAHNLPSRTRSLFSFTLSEDRLENAITETEKFGFYNEQEYLERLNSILNQMASDKLGLESHEEEITKQELKERIESFRDIGELVVDLENVAEEVREEKEKSHCAVIAEFLENWDGKDRGFIRFIKREKHSDGNRYLKIRYSCLNPQVSTEKPLNKSNTSVLMSGTLRPQEMYVDLLGIENATKATFESPFPEENELNLVIPTLTSKYSERGDDMIQKYAWYLAKSFEAVDGNCSVFFPSYQMMHQVKQELRDKTDRKVFVEKRRMDKEEKQEVLNDFAATKDEGKSVLLGVAAGSFGEGIDFPGKILKAVFVVGIPLKRPDIETNGLIDFYDEKFGKGWDYGYSYPAMNRAIQAAGRCIRSKDDKGVIVYMDERYDWSNYRKVFPPDKNLISTRAPWKEIGEFFGQQDL